MSKHYGKAVICRVATTWAEIIRLQASRLEAAIDRDHAALADEQLRAAIETAAPDQDICEVRW